MGSVKEGLGFIAAILFLSCLAGVACAIIPAFELSAFLSLFGIVEYHFERKVQAIACVFILGFFVVLWFSEDGPPRPGRGILKGDAPKLIGACVSISSFSWGYFWSWFIGCVGDPESSRRLMIPCYHAPLLANLYLCVVEKYIYGI
jgi:hypothetical protein